MIMMMMMMIIIIIIDIILPNGATMKSNFMAPCGLFSIFLPVLVVLEEVQFTAHDSCSYCDKHGEVVKTAPRGHVITLPLCDSETGQAIKHRH